LQIIDNKKSQPNRITLGNDSKNINEINNNNKLAKTEFDEKEQEEFNLLDKIIKYLKGKKKELIADKKKGKN